MCYSSRMRRRVLRAAVLGAVVLVSGCRDEGTVTVHSLVLKGVHAIDASRLTDALATRQNSRIPWGRKAYYDRARFDADVRRIQAFYADRGCPDARVSGVDIMPNRKGDAVDLTVTIVEGEPVKVVALHLVGFDGVPAAHVSEITDQAPLKVGQPRDRQFVLTTRELALNELRDHGFPYATVSTTEDDGADGKAATLTFTATPGPLAHFGPVAIQGNTSVSNHIVERLVAYKAGDLYQRSLLQDTQRRLYGVALFQFANVEPVNVEAQPTEVPTRITLAEGKHQRLNFGVGYGTEEKGRVDGEYHHLNFLGGARTAGVHVRYSSLDRGVRLDATQPYFLSPNVSLGAEVQDWYTFTPAYQSVVAGAKVTITHRSSARTSWAVSVSSEHDSSRVAEGVLSDLTLRNNLIALGLNPESGEQNGSLNALGVDVQHSTADDVLNARRGYQLSVHAEEAGRITPGTFKYSALSADGRHYLPMGDRLVFASRVQIGMIRPSGNDQSNIPFSKRYFLGGATTVRGWGRFEVSPLSDSGLPIGGDALLAVSGELRATLRGNFGGVLFVDGGNVWADSFGYRLNDLRYAIGPGLRYQTPVGPLRFDFGYQINPVPGLLVDGLPQARRWRMHFSIGQAF